MIRLYFHINHDRLCGLTSNIEERIAYINKNKPADEIPTRLRLLNEVRGPLPAGLVEAMSAYDEAKSGLHQYRVRLPWDHLGGDAFTKAKDVYIKAGVAYYETFKNAMPELERLHAIECPGCPWDGKTIFPRTLRDDLPTAEKASAAGVPSMAQNE